MFPLAFIEGEGLWGKDLPASLVVLVLVLLPLEHHKHPLNAMLSL